MDIGEVLFLRVYGPRRSQYPRSTRSISSPLDRTSLVNKAFIIWEKRPKHDKFYLRDKARIPNGQDSYKRFGSSCPLTELVI